MALAGVSLICCTAADCCGVGGPYLSAQAATDECRELACALGVGTTVIAYHDRDPADPIVDAWLDTPRLADVAVADGRIKLRGREGGSTLLHARTRGDLVIDSYLKVTDVRRTAVIVDPRAMARAPQMSDNPVLVYEGTALRLIADHRGGDYDGPLLGHGIETWSTTAGTLGLVAEPEPWLDHGRVRQVDTSFVTGLLEVSAGADTRSLAVDVVPPGSASRLVIEYQRQTVVFGDITLRPGTGVLLTVDPYAEDGRYILGSPRGNELSITVADPTIAIVTADDRARTLEITAVAAGTTTAIVALDGVRRQLTLRIETPGPDGS
jgi:hypothetical protein